MTSVPLASRAFRRKVVLGWISHASRQLLPEDIINDLIERAPGSVENFRAAVAGRQVQPYLSRSEKDLVWCSPREDFQTQFEAGKTGPELLTLLGTTWQDNDVVELSYPISVVMPLFKPSAVVAGPNPSFTPTPVSEEFGRTVGGLREMIHLPFRVVDVLVDGTALREWAK